MSDKKEKSNKSVKWIIGGCILLLAGAGTAFYSASQKFETTDNAQLDGDLLPVRSGLSGYIQDIRFADNQEVKKGDTLICLNNVELRADVNRILAELESAKANVRVTGSLADARYENARAASLATGSEEQSVQSSKASLERAEQALKRGQQLLDIKGITQDHYEQLQTQVNVAKAAYLKAQAQKESSSSSSTGLLKQATAERQQVSAAEAAILQKTAELEAAGERLKHAFIIAPFDGIVTKRTVQKEQYIIAGQALCALVSNKKLWVTANFKETQLNRIKPGQPVEIEVDAYKNIKLQGSVDSYGGATGSRFALIPPDNATGNFIKIAQRFPVKIRIDKPVTDSALLYPGLSVVVKVKVN